jgi:hypothetical protein
MRLAMFMWVVWAASALPVTAGSITVITARDAFEAAAGPSVLEEFTISQGTAAILTGPLNASSSYPAQFIFGSVRPGDIVPGVTFFSPGATDPITGELSAKFVVDHGGIASFDESFLATYTRGEPEAQPILVSFDQPVLAFGFVTDHVYTGDSFTATVRFSDGTDVTETIANDHADAENPFYGFVSDRSDIIGGAFIGSADIGASFAMDDFTFAIPLPPAVYAAPVMATCLAAAVRAHRGAPRR